MPTQVEVLDALRQGWVVEDEFVRQLNDAEREAVGTADRWAPKDMLAHIAAWNERIVQWISGKTPPPVEDDDTQNALFFEAHRHATMDQVLDKLKRLNGEMVSAVSRLSDADLQDTKLIPDDGERPAWRRIVGTACLHPLAHFVDYLAKRGDIRLAVSMYERAVEWLSPLDASPEWRSLLLYNLACMYALAGDKARAIEGLREALPLAPNLVEWSKQDTDLDSLRDDPALQALYA